MKTTYYNISELQKKCFSLLCVETFAGGGMWKCQIDLDSCHEGKFAITVSCEEERQLLEYVLSLRT